MGVEFAHRPTRFLFASNMKRFQISHPWTQQSTHCEYQLILTSHRLSQPSQHQLRFTKLECHFGCSNPHRFYLYHQFLQSNSMIWKEYTSLSPTFKRKSALQPQNLFIQLISESKSQILGESDCWVEMNNIPRFILLNFFRDNSRNQPINLRTKIWK